MLLGHQHNWQHGQLAWELNCGLSERVCRVGRPAKQATIDYVSKQSRAGEEGAVEGDCEFLHINFAFCGDGIKIIINKSIA